ncbi:hypothetical protein [Bradyrhizobium sp.]
MTTAAKPLSGLFAAGGAAGGVSGSAARAICRETAA